MATAFLLYYISMNVIFTDGAARGNPGPGGWGTVVVGEEKVVEYGGHEDHTTNNRMEIMAAITGLEQTTKSQNAVVYTDSAYLLSGITRWVFAWEKNNWKTSQKEDVLNRDLWERLMKTTSHRSVKWELLKGHSGIPMNERCDVIATSFADERPIVLYNGSRERYGVSLDIVAKTMQNIVQKNRNRIPAHSYVSMVDGIVKVHATWMECKTRAFNKPGARFKKAISQADEDDIVREFGGK